MWSRWSYLNKGPKIGKIANLFAQANKQAWIKQNKPRQTKKVKKQMLLVRPDILFWSEKPFMFEMFQI